MPIKEYQDSHYLCIKTKQNPTNTWEIKENYFYLFVYSPLPYYMDK